MLLLLTKPACWKADHDERPAKDSFRNGAALTLSPKLPFELDVLLAVDGLERMLVSPLICEEYASTQSFRLFMTV